MRTQQLNFLRNGNRIGLKNKKNVICINNTIGGKVGESKRFKSKMIVKFSKWGGFKDYTDTEHVLKMEKLKN
jgi:hypothetical protein